MWEGFIGSLAVPFASELIVSLAAHIVNLDWWNLGRFTSTG